MGQHFQRRRNNFTCSGWSDPDVWGGQGDCSFDDDHADHGGDVVVVDDDDDDNRMFTQNINPIDDGDDVFTPTSTTGVSCVDNNNAAMDSSMRSFDPTFLKEVKPVTIFQPGHSSLSSFPLPSTSHLFKKCRADKNGTSRRAGRMRSSSLSSAVPSLKRLQEEQQESNPEPHDEINNKTTTTFKNCKEKSKKEFTAASLRLEQMNLHPKVEKDKKKTKSTSAKDKDKTSSSSFSSSSKHGQTTSNNSSPPSNTNTNNSKSSSSESRNSKGRKHNKNEKSMSSRTVAAAPDHGPIHNDNKSSPTPAAASPSNGKLHNLKSSSSGVKQSISTPNKLSELTTQKYQGPTTPTMSTTTPSSKVFKSYSSNKLSELAAAFGEIVTTEKQPGQNKIKKSGSSRALYNSSSMGNASWTTSTTTMRKPETTTVATAADKSSPSSPPSHHSHSSNNGTSKTEQSLLPSSGKDKKSKKDKCSSHHHHHHHRSSSNLVGTTTLPMVDAVAASSFHASLCTILHSTSTTKRMTTTTPSQQERKTRSKTVPGRDFAHSPRTKSTRVSLGGSSSILITEEGNNNDRSETVDLLHKSNFSHHHNPHRKRQHSGPCRQDHQGDQSSSSISISQHDEASSSSNNGSGRYSTPSSACTGGCNSCANTTDTAVVSTALVAFDPFGNDMELLNEQERRKALIRRPSLRRLKSKRGGLLMDPEKYSSFQVAVATAMPMHSPNAMDDKSDSASSLLFLSSASLLPSLHNSSSSWKPSD